MVIKKLSKVVFPISFITPAILLSTGFTNNANDIEKENTHGDDKISLPMNPYFFSVTQGALVGVNELLFLKPYEYREESIPYLCETKDLYIASNSNETINGQYFIKNIAEENDKWKENVYCDNAKFGDKYNLNAPFGIEKWSDCMSEFLYMTPKNLLPFNSIALDVKLYEQSVLGYNEWINRIHAKIYSSKDTNTRYIFDTYDELMMYKSTKLNEYNGKQAINSIPIISLGEHYNYLGKLDASLKFLISSSINLKICPTAFNIDDLFAIKNINANYATLSISEDFAAPWFATLLTSFPCKFTISYETADINGKNIRVKKIFTLNDFYDEIRININNKFVPLSLELEEYNDKDTFIQKCWTDKIKIY